MGMSFHRPIIEPSARRVSALMARRAAGLVVTAALLAGCAAATPGYVPERGRLKPGDTARAGGSATPVGAYDAKGVYTPSPFEQSMTCTRLTGIVRVKLDHMRSAAGGPETTIVTRAAGRTMAQPMHGRPLEAHDEPERRRDRARLEGLNRALVSKGCQPVDLDGSAAPVPETVDRDRPKARR